MVAQARRQPKLSPVARVQVFRLADGSFAVPSSSEPGKAYRVTAAGICECPGHHFAGHCKHSAAVVADVERRERQTRYSPQAQACWDALNAEADAAGVSALEYLYQLQGKPARHARAS